MRSRALLVVTVVVGLSACATLLTRPLQGLVGGGSGDRILFPHATHKAAGVDCTGCHEAVPRAQDLDTRLLPREEKCLECHSDWKEVQPGLCGACHLDVAQARHWDNREHVLNFSHQNHVPRAKEDCSRCHAQLSHRGEGATTIGMDTCTGCHQHRKDYDEGRCDRCHRDLSGEQLKPIATFRHQGNYVRDHRLYARTSSTECFRCHDQNFCLDCHTSNPAVRVEMKNPENVQAQYIHRGDFISRHSMEARADPSLCLRCHGQSACNSCHTAMNLTPAGDSPRDPHPKGWAVPGNRQFHGSAARMDPVSCAACHDQGASSNCVDCHKVGGPGGNPHPGTWSSMHSKADISRNGMCMYCHQQ